jgi:hypothetical protein
MWDWALISSLNVQNLIVSNTANIPSCRSFSWWIRGRDCAMNIFIDILLQNLRRRSILSYRDDVEKLTRRHD